MASNYAGVNAFHPQITIPSDGDPAVSESVNTSLRSIQDDCIYFNTNLGFKVDVRGGNFPLTGVVNIAGSASTGFNIIAGLIQLGSGAGIVDIEAATTKLNGTNVNVTAANTYLSSPITTVGSSTSQEFAVNANTDFYGPVALHSDLVAGHNVSVSTLDVSDAADFNCDVQLTHSGQLATVGGSLNVQQDAQFNGTTRSAGSTHWGNSATDGHLFTGDVEMQNDLVVDGGLTVQQAIVSNASSGNSLGSTEIGGALNVLGDTTLGNSSSDAVTFNAVLSGGLAMGANGRVLPSATILALTVSQTLTLSSPRTLVANTTGGTPVGGSWTIDDTGMSPGDEFVIFLNAPSGSRLSIAIGGSIATATLTAVVPAAGQAAQQMNGVMWAKKFGTTANDWYIWVSG